LQLDVHKPALQTALATFKVEHARPQPPQCEVLVAMLISQPSSAAGASGWPQLAQPATQLELHLPSLHAGAVTLAVLQMRPHAPQSPVSVSRLLSQPSSAAGAAGCTQLPKPGLQLEVQTPPLHATVPVLAVEHCRLHAPQCLVSFERSTSQPLAATPSQSWKPGSQLPIEQFPALHCETAFGRLQGLLQKPQCAVEVLVSVSHTVPGLPSHSPLPAGHWETTQVPLLQVQVPACAVQSLVQLPQAVGSESVFTSQPLTAP
jgi:hypothetical protein